MRIAGRILALLAALTLAGCYRNNFPVDLAFAPESARPATIRVSVDADGTFFPDCWNQFLQAGKKWRGRSLLGTPTAINATLRDCKETTTLDVRLKEAREGQLAAIGQQIADAGRVFIFVHGYNNSHAEADAGYDQLERAIQFFQPDPKNGVRGDLIIRFYWDGYVADSSLKGAASPAYFWFKAVKNSQLAGMYGLRPILALATRHDQRVIIISHSRGASVILSALSNPTFGTDWRERWAERIARLPYRLNPPALADGAPIDLVMLAPAIGTLDFCKPGSALKPSCAKREFPERFRSLSFTRNRNDGVLKKFVGFAHRFYPTSLGASTKQDIGPTVAGMIAPRPVKRIELENQYVHSFVCYASNPAFPKLLGGLPPPLVAASAYRTSIAQRPECSWHDVEVGEPVQLTPPRP